MKTTSPKMALKPYLEALRKHCESLSKAELTEVMEALAQEVPVGARSDYLEKIRSLTPKSTTEKREITKDVVESVLERVAALKEEIEERIGSIEDGSYWDQAGHWDEDDWDEEPDSVTEEQMDELENLFLEAADLFLGGRLGEARRIYGALFGLLDEHEGISSGLSKDAVDIREARARYCRCVFETAPPELQVDDFFDAMNVLTPIRSYRLDLASEELPLLRDVEDARFGEPAALESFLPAWEKKLASCDTNRGAILRMEAVRQLEGMNGLSRLARQWNSGQPFGYLYWIQCLEEKQDWEGMLDASREALDALPRNSLREQAAEYLVRAATELGQKADVLLGKREAFLSAPDEINLLNLLQEAANQNRRSEELDAVLTFGAKSEKKSEEYEGLPGDLHLKMLLMAGRLEEAFREGQDEGSLGWSYGKAGILFAGILSVLTGNSQKGVVIRTVLKEYCDIRYSGFAFERAEEENVHEEIIKGLESVELTKSEEEKYIQWAERMGRERAERIVSGQHRRAYDRAAQAICALAECYVLDNEKEKARSLLHEFHKIKFPRHRAFQGELKGVVAKSTLLRELRIV